jgi:branched-subunit amino acid permease
VLIDCSVLPYHLFPKVIINLGHHLSQRIQLALAGLLLIQVTTELLKVIGVQLFEGINEEENEVGPSRIQILCDLLLLDIIHKCRES